MSNEELISTHRLRVDGDTVLTRYVGVPELEHVQAIHQRFDLVLAEHGRLFVINDMRRSGIPSAQTRRWISEWARAHQVNGVVNFGASLTIRMLQSLVFHATILLGKQMTIGITNCASETDAFAWVAAQRSQLR